MRQRALSNKVIQPDYASLSGVVFHHRAEGLVTNSTNAAGVVDVSGNITKIISMDPHITGNEFDSHGTAPTLSGGAIVYGGAGRHRHNGASSQFNNFHHRASITDLKWAVHGVIKVGSSSNPGAIYGMFGNNGTSTASKGMHSFYNDSTVNNGIQIGITKGTLSTYITLAANTNIFTPNTFIDFWIQVDKSLDQEDQVKLFMNGFRFVVSNRIDNSTTATTPTYAMEIGSCGNASVPAVMTLKEITFQDALNTDAFRQQFITDRMFKYGIAAFPNQIDGIPLSSDWDLYDTLDENRYYLTNHLCQKPSDPNTIVSIFADGTDHLFDADQKISMRISTDKGRTWSAKSDAFLPPSGDEALDHSAGYGDDDRLHLIVPVHTSGSVNSLWYSYSDDDGSTWSTAVDITSIFTLGAETVFRTYGQIIENNSVLLCPFYKQTPTATASTRMVLRSTNNGTTWTPVQIEASATYRNETDIVALSSSFLLAVTRDESTLEWYQSVSTDNGLNWTNQGALTFGESLTGAAPVRLHTFLISGTLVVSCIINDRNNDLTKIIYALASDIVASGIAGWNSNTKVTIHQGSNDNHLHYGDLCYYDNDFKAIGMFVIDPFPGSGAGTENALYTFDVPTFQYPFVKSGLGL
jgi:hypothetical protein